MMNFCRNVVNVRCFLFGQESAQVVTLAVHPNLSGPLVRRFVPCHTFVTTRVVQLLATVSCILLPRAFSQVMAAVIQRVSVSVVSFFSWLTTKYKTVHPFFLIRPSVKTSTMPVPVSVPRPLREPIKIFGVNNRSLSFGQRDIAVGWVERLNNFVSHHTLFWHVLPHRRMCFSR